MTRDEFLASYDRYVAGVRAAVPERSLPAFDKRAAAIRERDVTSIDMGDAELRNHCCGCFWLSGVDDDWTDEECERVSELSTERRFDFWMISTPAEPT